MEPNSVHYGILNKFESLKGTVLYGKREIKGIDKNFRVPADRYVSEDHILHDLIRGFYKPAGKPYLLSYQATELETNYGQQIEWEDKEKFVFSEIRMKPPSGVKDNRKKSDIEAARYNMQNEIPIGILYKTKKSVNAVLGLGKIVKETDVGTFIVKPFNYREEKHEITPLIDNELFTEKLTSMKNRIGQTSFRNLLIGKYNTCHLCGVLSKYSVASHIKPWRDSNDVERLDINNGLLLCPNHDFVFDQALITFDESGQIIISSELDCVQRSCFNINNSMKIELNDGMEFYMKFHRLIYLSVLH